VSVLPVSLWGEAWLTADPFWCLCALPFKPGHRDWQLSDTFLPLPRSESESDLSSGSGSGKDLGSWSPFSVYGFVLCVSVSVADSVSVRWRVRTDRDVCTA